MLRFVYNNALLGNYIRTHLYSSDAGAIVLRECRITQTHTHTHTHPDGMFIIYRVYGRIPFRTSGSISPLCEK